ncbi:UDP-glucose 4-epimerase GalE [Reichenbachiella agarivorans]|uniref:UDP-glucose 4-epimerase n=1 Tax=Reichenbachiella agarivorans TaxID=2979464 RepID=A0ABY6CJJ3_9BACT|nr:UDP-glucose 4-epimerase GalE [Reichenbachiella agarivorans]UXP30559.1 UDP-glucose 4-epimerase GalE [Reichenbachiella agarivorans]
MKNILVTGGMGYIGSHTCVELIQAGLQPIIIDNLDNSEIWIKDRLEEITGAKFPFYQADCANKDVLEQVFQEHKIEGVIHFAANKAVGESVSAPLKYYNNNINSLLSVLEVSNKYNCQNLVFSSSCTVYGEPDMLPVDENAAIKQAESPYGSTKIFCETIIQDFIKSQKNYKSILLRYFNPIGAHSSSLIGELPLGVPGNLVPFITQTACGLREKLTVFGNDYNTVDGSCIRDYIHVVDLAKAHVKAFEYLFKQTQPTCTAINIGTGVGYSVLQLVQTFEQATGVNLNYEIGPKRAGDVEAVYANATKAKQLLNWESELTMEDALIDSWNWQKTLER